ncbi:AraC family transcriptional regulator [Termitidicoccus mucosus]|uniref:AraC family transcriptional regulator n=1 Tax=Termitidicoccus mucosus TaxID=1184151 RepID=A0A178IFI3_9BACT|nr:AraC family transcriptional regulator [Opitutaceae bacterium TSB47]
MDALAAIVTLLRPQAVGTKIIHGAGRWGVCYPALGQPSFALVLKGPCWLAVDGIPATMLDAGDFVLFPAMPGFTMASDPKVKPSAMKLAPSERQAEEVFHGDATKEPSVSMLGGYFSFDPINASMLLDSLPRMLRIRAADPSIGSVAAIVELIRREARENRAGRALVLARLIEVMLVEALRSVPAGVTATGLLAGLREPRLAAALRAIHTKTARPWTLATLAREAGMSRSAFAERFARVIGRTPLNYLLQWRLAVARDLLARERKPVAETALAVGYESASGFSTAFSRETGQSPKEFIGSHRGGA